MSYTAAGTPKAEGTKKENRPGGSAEQQTRKHHPAAVVQHLDKLEGAACGICLDEIATNAIKTLACGHLFCSACVDYWILVGKEICPLCREPIRLDEKYNLKLNVQ